MNTNKTRALLLSSIAISAPAWAQPKSTPKEMLGTWRWTTISGSNYVGRDGRITDNAGGMSVTFTFMPGNRYKFFFFVRQKTYSLVTEATTTHEGTVVFGKDRFTLKPVKGHYRGSSTGSKVVNRSMSRAEMKKNNVYAWKWAEENGKKFLMAGPGSTPSSRFTKQK
jgi:hypothetical protein